MEYHTFNALHSLKNELRHGLLPAWLLPQLLPPHSPPQILPPPPPHIRAFIPTYKGHPYPHKKTYTHIKGHNNYLFVHKPLYKRPNCWSHLPSISYLGQKRKELRFISVQDDLQVQDYLYMHAYPLRHAWTCTCTCPCMYIHVHPCTWTCMCLPRNCKLPRNIIKTSTESNEITQHMSPCKYRHPETWKIPQHV